MCEFWSLKYAACKKKGEGEGKVCYKTIFGITHKDFGGLKMFSYMYKGDKVITQAK